MSKIEDFIRNNKVFITEDALSLIENINDKEILEKILQEIREKKELITKEIVLDLLNKYSKTPSLKETDLETKKREIKEISDITMGYKLFLEDRFFKLKKIIERISGRKSNLNSADLIKLNDKTPVLIAGMLYSKEEGKYGALVMEFEDPEGSFRVIVSKNNKETFEIATKMELDDVALIEGKLIKTERGNYIKASKFYLPDLEYQLEKKEDKEIFVACISDIRCGNESFDEEAFQHFIDFLNGKIQEYRDISHKIKYLIISGDLIEGFSLESKYKTEIIDDMYQQYEDLYKLLSKIREDIMIYAIPGERDQLIKLIPFKEFEEEIVSPLLKLKNLTLLGDPETVTIFNTKIYLTHGYYFEENFKKKFREYEDPRETLIETIKEVIRKRYVLSNIRINGLMPLGYDPFVINERPDAFICGHFDIAAHGNYRGCVIISNSSWLNYIEKQEPSHSCYVINIKDLSIRRFFF